MRRQLFMALLTLIMGIVLCFGFVACDNGRTPPTPTKLGDVTVTLENDAAFGKPFPMPVAMPTKSTKAK